MTESTDEFALEAANPELLTEEQDAAEESFSLPTFDDVTDEKIISYVRGVFSGFTFDANTDYSKEFTAPEQLAEYVEQTMRDIHEKQHAGLTAKITHSSAALTRFWAMGYVVDETLNKASYGNGAVGRIASMLGKSVPYIYQIRAVATQLTMQDAFLLGMRECCSTTTLRKLAQIKDDDRRRQIIDIFIEETHDLADATRIERAVKAFRLAINEALKHVDTLQQDTTNPEAVVTSAEELAGPSYANALNALKQLKKETKKLSLEDTVYQICDALGEFAITESVPNAQQRLDELKEEANAAKQQALQARDNINDILTEVESLLHVEVLKNEDPELDLDIE